MKWTLTLTACLLASTFSTPALARHLHEGVHGKGHAHSGHALHLAARHSHWRHAGRRHEFAAAHRAISVRSGQPAAARAAAEPWQQTPGSWGPATQGPREIWPNDGHNRIVSVPRGGLVEPRRARRERHAAGWRVAPSFGDTRPRVAHQREFAGGATGGSVGIASYYGGRGGLTAAHRTLPFGTRVRVTNLSNGSTVTVRINDRGPFVRNRAIDLSYGAARAIGMTGAGLARVRWSVI